LSETGRAEAVVLAAGAAPLDAFLARSETIAAAVVGRDGAIVSANGVLERLVGPVTSIYDAVAEGQSTLIADLLAGADQTWRSSRAGLTATDGRIVDCELSTLAHGEQVLVVAEPLREPADRLNLYLLELNDELIAARRELADGNRRLRELDALKNMFIASATHDLKTPLTSIVGYAELLDEEALDDSARPMVATIVRSAKRLVAMIDDLLGAALVMSGELTLERSRVDVAAVLRDAVEAIEPIATGGGVTVDLTGTSSAIAFVDESRVQQILDNLLSNAVKYSPDGGHVEVSCSLTADDVTIAVSDSGIGIPPGEQERIFDRFFRASTARDRGIEGTGLGLANARAFAEAHGGRLDAGSEPGVGSTFTLVLPVGKDDG
jgi:signal transduction histidine kinase